MDSLRKLPAGATYRKKQGQATATASMRGDTLIFIATCDSLANLVFQLEEELHQARDSLYNQQVISEPAVVSIKAKFEWYLAGFITAFIVYLIIKIRKK